MKRTILTALLAFAFGIGLMLLAASPSMAVHSGAGDLTCGGCHTMHNSQGNVNMEGDPAGDTVRLLRGLSTHKLCLGCHSTEGSQASTAHPPHGQPAPKVHTGAITKWAQTDSFDRIGAGGISALS